MPDYLVLVASSANRVYTRATPRLVAAELRFFAEALLPGQVGQITEESLGGVDYLGFTGPDLTEEQVAALGNLSGLHALFRRQGDLLEPLPVSRLNRFPDDLVTIPKYQGKTNELLTTLLLNVTALASARPQRLFTGELRVLDPLCGRATTLNQAMMYGLNAIGVDVDQRDTEAYVTFLTTWLKTYRYKHQVERSTLRMSGTVVGRRVDIQFAADRADYKDGRVQRLAVLTTDSTALTGLIKAGSMDVLVADTPYGVRHGSHADRLSRHPADLLTAALPGWVRLLRPGGAVGLAFNRHVAPRDRMSALLEQAGLVLHTGVAEDAFRHRVDRAIDRDLIIAAKPAHPQPADHPPPR